MAVGETVKKIRAKLAGTAADEGPSPAGTGGDGGGSRGVNGSGDGGGGGSVDAPATPFSAPY